MRFSRTIFSTALGRYGILSLFLMVCIKEIFEHGRKYKFPRLAHCLKEGCGSNRVWGHGYKRVIPSGVSAVITSSIKQKIDNLMFRQSSALGLKNSRTRTPGHPESSGNETLPATPSYYRQMQTEHLLRTGCHRYTAKPRWSAQTG